MLFRICAGVCLGVETVGSEKPDFATKALDGVYLRGRSLFGYEYRAFDAELIHCICNCSTMIAAGCGNAACFAFFFRQ